MKAYVVTIQTDIDHRTEGPVYLDRGEADKDLEAAKKTLAAACDHAWIDVVEIKAPEGCTQYPQVIANAKLRNAEQMIKYIEDFCVDTDPDDSFLAFIMETIRKYRNGEKPWEKR